LNQSHFWAQKIWLEISKAHIKIFQFGPNQNKES
jgi:hypothetical protein